MLLLFKSNKMGWLGRQPTRRCVESNCLEDTNCHPFNFENWLFQHNGSVPEFSKLKRQLMFDIEPKLFPFIEGSTDSETLFFLALTFGLRDDPPATLARTMGHVEHAREQAGIEQPIFFSACMTDGKRLWARDTPATTSPGRSTTAVTFTPCETSTGPTNRFRKARLSYCRSPWMN